MTRGADIAFASEKAPRPKPEQSRSPDKTQFWIDSGVPLVIDRREGYEEHRRRRFKRLIEGVHLDGGHREPGRHRQLARRWLLGSLATTQRFDIGNHHFPLAGRHRAGPGPGGHGNPACRR